jgi:hypothetical protein
MGTTRTRDALTAEGLPPEAVVLPGDELTSAPLEGALVVRADERDSSSGGWRLETVDYGRGFLLRRFPSRDAALHGVVEYVSRPLPPVSALGPVDVAAAALRVEQFITPLAARARAAGDAGVLVEVPPGVPLDRVGALDGVHLYVAGTDLEARSLPPTAVSAPARVHVVMTTGVVLMRAVVTPPWFGRPGGALRFTVADAGTGLRDLVVGGLVERVEGP